MALVVVPANRVGCDDLAAVMDSRSSAARCQCQRYRLAPGESFRTVPAEARAARLREQTACGDPRAAATSGLVALLDEEPAGWCAVAPRASYGGLVHNANQTAWRGRREDRDDPSVWAITCLLTRPRMRRRGVATALVAAAVRHARDSGATRLEAYPFVEGAHTLSEEEHPGPLAAFLDAGFTVAHRPSKRRAVVSLEL